jgi:hypothetical protein
MSRVKRVQLKIFVIDEPREFRRWISEGRLLTEDEFRLRRAVTPARLARLTTSGSVFSVVVDGRPFYPTFLVDAAYNRRRLEYVCRILWPAPPSERLFFLTQRYGSLGEITPLQALADEKNFKQLLIVARGWASEYSRTVVKICAGEFSPGTELPVVCTGVEEIDPRLNLWRRAREALHDGGNLRPEGPYARLSTATVFITRDTAPGPRVFDEARLDIVVARGHAHASAVFANYPRCDLLRVRVSNSDDIVTVVRKVLDAN